MAHGAEFLLPNQETWIILRTLFLALILPTSSRCRYLEKTRQMRTLAYVHIVAFTLPFKSKHIWEDTWVMN